MIGSVSSTMVTIKLLVAVLPAASEAVRVTVTGEFATLNVLPLVGDAVKEVTPQLSDALASIQFKICPQEAEDAKIVVSEGVPVITGSSSSITVMLKDAMESLPLTSMAV